ncbi:GNAT family N-acetyltransferase [Chryseobacterium pennipullorum]|uniref:GNAT family N-acetyltransferase n=1 Tax=Chryseobacterium pennipullorum TaxID=2258963 RepID=A0A3D9B2I0_9FLAO|nr:GNAT family N-acetyltransferase [Chryseobacterium pennipullorum]REC47426.1 GNAT family N-acetyltransferase [Chryseobacterium pennipullorum]
MNLRKMKEEDQEAIADLLDQLGYPDTTEFLSGKIKKLLEDPDEYLIVAEDSEAKVIAFISVHIIPQIAVEGDFARISYFSVDKDHRSLGTGRLMEEYCEKIARERACNRIELHCHANREKAHQFYDRQGYTESPKYLMKIL